mmetsp:Transcript_21936/g.19481  ORF Transcript_21936/g.19481 Transcript_21936/m.19481 type:complete len:202 (+) Transcript_21936:684-1289(+)
MEFDEFFIKKNLFELDYTKMIFIREDIDLWPKDKKIKTLLKIIDRLSYKVFEEKFDYEPSDSDSDRDSDEETSKYEKYLQLIENNSVFYFPLIHKLYRSQYNKLNLEGQEIIQEKPKNLEEEEKELKKPKKKTFDISNIDLRPQKSYYRLELDQKIIDTINEGNFNQDNISKISKVFNYLVSNPDAHDKIMKIVLDSNTKI